MTDIERLSLGQLAILKQLATYRYLTTNHMLRLNISSSRRYIYKLLKDIVERKKALVGALDFGATPTIGRLHNIYYLTAYGAEILAEAKTDLETIKYPKKVRVFGHDYWHRINCIDCHINVNLWAKTTGATVNYFDTYYDQGTVSNEGRIYPKTRIAWEEGQIVPDAIFSFTPEGDQERLCVLELHNGTDASRLVKQLKTYRTVLGRGTVEAVYDYQKSARLLLVFEKAPCLSKTQALLQKNNTIEGREKQVFMQTLASNSTDFKNDWETIDGKPISLF
ncbi:MAG: hypothetical protein COB22_08785 [Cycloclasticus sp.]|nr:MAG: hypothetical protein COB22_08785 [Cycloclasticus sp.]